MTPTAPIISVTNLGVCYKRYRLAFTNRVKRYWALRDVSLEVYAGETVGVVGKNAAGKTTFLKALAGIIRPDRGLVTRSEMNISLLSLQVGFVAHLSGRENAILSGMLLGLNKSEALDQLPRIAEFSELGDFLEEPIATYSAGMRARLGFSVAYFAAPDVLLIDEVLGVGDRDFRVKSAAAIRQTIGSNRTVILVSHDMATIRRLCDRVIWIDDGKTKLVGTPDVVIPAYNDHFDQVAKGSLGTHSLG